jgi:hypothetical protein
MNRQALDVAVIGRLDEEALREERAPREAQTHARAVAPNYWWELTRRVYPIPRRGFQGSPSPLGKDGQ